MYRFKFLLFIPLHLFSINSFSQECLNGDCNDGYGEYQYATGAVYKGEWENGKRIGQGTTISANGETYVGEYENDERSGKGTYIFPSGETYTGEWKEGRRHGFGTLLYQNGITEYIGYFQEGKITGTGRKNYANGNSYNGDWLNSKYHGYGVLTDNEGNQYKGTWNQDKLSKGEFIQGESGNKYMGPFKRLMAHGKGTYHFNSGSWNGGVYEGDFEDDMIQGEGTFVSSNGSIYVGDWVKNDLVKGELTTKSGETYEGDFDGFNYEGTGTYTYLNGSIYRGEWKNNFRDGDGKVTYTDGASYEGEWKNNNYHGKGTYTYADGTITVGDFLNGYLNGKGLILWKDGDQFIGDFQNDMRSGYGTFIASDGGVLIDEWLNDKPIDRDNSKQPLELLEEDKGNFISLSVQKPEATIYNLDEYKYFEMIYDKKNVDSHLYSGECISNYDIYDEDLHEKLGVKKFININKSSTHKLNADDKKLSQIKIRSLEFMESIASLLSEDNDTFCVILTDQNTWYGGTYKQAIDENFFFGALDISPIAFCDYIETSETFKSLSIEHNIGCVVGKIYKNEKQDNSENNEPEISFGSGFFINNEGYFLTNHHTIDNCSLVEVNISGNSYDAEIISEDSVNDIAIGKIDVTGNPSLKIGNENIEQGQNIVVAGFPLYGKLSDEVKINSGIISGLSGMSNDSNLFQIDAAVQPGNSGGPVLNQYGEWIGIVSSMAKDDFFYELSGQYPENINFAIKITSPMGLIKSNGLKADKNFFLFKTKLDTVKITELAKKATIHLTCNKNTENKQT